MCAKTCGQGNDCEERVGIPARRKHSGVTNVETVDTVDTTMSIDDTVAWAVRHPGGAHVVMSTS